MKTDQRGGSETLSNEGTPVRVNEYASDEVFPQHRIIQPTGFLHRQVRMVLSDSGGVYDPAFDDDEFFSDSDSSIDPPWVDGSPASKDIGIDEPESAPTPVAGHDGQGRDGTNDRFGIMQVA